MLDSSTLSKDGRDSYRISQTLTDDLYPSYKILVIGDANTGKTSLIRRYVSNEFLEDNESTIGLDFQSKKYK
jgi:GTPase SAR1 family protein